MGQSALAHLIPYNPDMNVADLQAKWRDAMLTERSAA